jgi:bifunctional non-homologous end joining protein LigD
MAFQPMPLSRRPAPFDHPEWVFELKYDGFRSLAVIHDGRCELISRNGHPFNSFNSLRKVLTVPCSGRTVLDGEIVCIDKRGRPQFNDLLFHRGEPRRKQELRRLLSRSPASRLQYVDHVHEYGAALFQRVCEMDLEGIVAKHSYGPYVTEAQRTTWFKIKNRSYSQMAGREELFNRERSQRTCRWLACLRSGMR